MQFKSTLPLSLPVVDYLFTPCLSLLGSAGYCAVCSSRKCVVNREVAEFPLVDKLSNTCYMLKGGFFHMFYTTKNVSAIKNPSPNILANS